MAKRKDIRKYYYDMEPAWAKIEAEGKVGWPLESRACFTFLVLWSRKEAFKQKARVLEVGCGGGELALEIAKRDILVDACDFSESAIRICSKKSPPQNLNFIVGNAMTHKGFPNPPYDYIIANQFLQGIIGGDRVFFLKRARENLAKDGVIIVSTLLGIPEYLVQDVNEDTRVNSANTQYFADLDMFADELAQAGLKVTRHVLVEGDYRIFFLARMP